MLRRDSSFAMAQANVPRYIELVDSVFHDKIKLAKQMLSKCCLCPRQCQVDRIAGHLGYCNAGAYADVAHWQLHYGEEPPFSQNGGAGTIFFAHCNMHCIYCQNYQISQQQGNKNIVSVDGLADMMLKLQQEHAENIDLVSPTQFMPVIIEAIYCAKQQGLRLPIIYNTNGYEEARIIKLLEGIVDVYMPDLKYDSEDAGRCYSDVSDYVYYAKNAIRIMKNQVGGFTLNEKAQGLKGLFVRHLVLPNNIAATKEVLDFLHEEIGTDIGLSLMSQYAPCYMADKFRELDRTLYEQEYEQVVDYAHKLGFEKCWIQELKSNDVYFPDFKQPNVF